MSSQEAGPGHAILPSDLRLVVLEGKSAIVDQIARGAPMGSLLDSIVTLAGRVLTGRQLAFVGRTGDVLHILAGTGLRPFLNAQLSRPLAENPVATSIQRREAVIVLDRPSATPWGAFCSEARASGIASFWSQPVFSVEGEVAGALIVTQDTHAMPSASDIEIVEALCPLVSLVIGQHHAKQKLKAAKDRFRSLAANLPGVIYQRVVRPDGSIRYTYVSEGAREMFGVSPQEIIANPDALFSRHGPEYRPTFRENLLKASRELTLWDVEAQIVTRDGQEKWTHAIARPRRMNDGSVVWDGIILDATRLKRANIELAAANRAKSDFLATMSHELRTPLNAIIGFAEVMAAQSFGPLGAPRYVDYAHDIAMSGRHLLSLINDILDLSRVEAGRMSLDEELIAVAPVLEACLRLIKERALQGSVSVYADLPPDLPRFFGDERKLKQVLLNLLSNAVKFTPAGGKVVISAAVPEDGSMIVRVEDTGIGIQQEDLVRIGLPFVQVDSGLNRKFEGTGLGLALSRAMIELHQGTLSIESEFGTGTTVTIHLPASRVFAIEGNRAVSA